LLGSAALVALSAGCALAADLTLKAPVYKAAPYSVPYSWAGFYVGGNLGYGVARNQSAMNTPLLVPGVLAGPETFTPQPGGVFGGLQAGYNWQVGQWVFGLETDIQSSGQKDNQTCVYQTCFTNPAGVLFFASVVQQRMPWLGTARARVGYAEFGPVITYVTGGLAYGKVETSISNTFASVLPSATLNLSSTRVGWTLGSGVEAALDGNWTAKAEYLYVDLGRQSGTVNNVVGFPTGFNSRIQEHLFRGGLNYRFGGPGGSVAALEPVVNWTGLFVGANLGYGLARNPSGNVEPGGVVWNERFNLAPTGILGGVQAGFNWQVQRWVLGVETDIQWGGQKDNWTCVDGCDLPNTGAAAAVGQKMSWLGTVRGRFGYAVGPNLFYATGGLAYGNVTDNLNRMNTGIVPLSVSFDHTKSGWTVGAGIENKTDFFGLLGPNWTTRTEYLYVDLGSVSDPYTFNGTGNVFNSTIREHIWRSGLNYKFGDAVVAKY
jgi:outer membrane immunogenic protein